MPDKKTWDAFYKEREQLDNLRRSLDDIFSRIVDPETETAPVEIRKKNKGIRKKNKNKSSENPLFFQPVIPITTINAIKKLSQQIFDKSNRSKFMPIFKKEDSFNIFSENLAQVSNELEFIEKTHNEKYAECYQSISDAYDKICKIPITVLNGHYKEVEQRSNWIIKIDDVLDDLIDSKYIPSLLKEKVLSVIKEKMFADVHKASGAVSEENEPTLTRSISEDSESTSSARMTKVTEGKYTAVKNRFSTHVDWQSFLNAITLAACGDRNNNYWNYDFSRNKVFMEELTKYTVLLEIIHEPEMKMLIPPNLHEALTKAAAAQREAFTQRPKF